MAKEYCDENEFTGNSFHSYIHNSTSSNNNIQSSKFGSRCHTTCFLIPFDLHLAGQDFARVMGIPSFGKLLNIALLEYMINHKDDAKKPVNINISMVQESPKEPRKEKEICNWCKEEKHGTLIDTMTNKEYAACITHHRFMPESKRWKQKQ